MSYGRRLIGASVETTAPAQARLAVPALHGVALLGYTLLSVWLTWPLAAYWGSAYVGYIEEASRNAWNMWWVRYALEHGQNIFWSNMLFYPEGVQLYVQPINLSNTLITLPVFYLFGLTAAHNTAVLLAFALSGYGGFVLARRFVAGFAIPFLVGALLTAGPHHLVQFEINHLNILSIQWLPLYLWALIRLDDERHAGWALAVAALFVLNALTDWYWALLCAMMSAVWWGSGLLRREGRRKLPALYALAGLVAGAGLAPLLLGIVRFREALPTRDLAVDTAWRDYIRGFSSDLSGLFLPNMLHPFWRERLKPALEGLLAPFYSSSGWYIAAGWVLLACALVGLLYYGREQWRLALVGGVAWLFALGPSLRLLGFDTGIPMPYALIERIELLSVARKPSHFAFICILVATVFAALGLRRLTNALPAQRRPVLLWGVAALATVELWPASGHAVQRFSQPALLAQLGARPGVVADLPLERTETGRALRHQLAHEQPLVGGYVSRPPRYESLNYQPLIAQLGRMRPWPLPDIIPLDQAALAAIQCAAPIRHVLVNHAEASPTQLAGLATVLERLNGSPLAPVYSDGAISWYELPRYSEACRPFIYPGRGWQPPEHDPARVWRWIGSEGELWVVNPFDRPLAVTVRLSGEAYGVPRRAELWEEERLLMAWTFDRAARSYDLVLQLPPGRHQFTLRTSAAPDPASRRELGLSINELRVVERVLR